MQNIKFVKDILWSKDSRVARCNKPSHTEESPPIGLEWGLLSSESRYFQLQKRFALLGWMLQECTEETLPTQKEREKDLHFPSTIWEGLLHGSVYSGLNWWIICWNPSLLTMASGLMSLIKMFRTDSVRAVACCGVCFSVKSHLWFLNSSLCCIHFTM